MAAATRETSFANENYEDVYLPTYTEAIGVASVSPNQPPPLYGSNPSLVSSTTSQLSPPSYVCFLVISIVLTVLKLSYYTTFEILVLVFSFSENEI